MSYRESITTEMKVNRVVAKIVRPIVNREIAKGVGGYLERVKEHLDQ